jgi:hypothetical protein
VVRVLVDSEIADFLRDEGLWQGDPDISVLRGGYWNKVFRVITDTRSIVVKQFTTVISGTLFPNLPEDEARALGRLTGLQVAPELIGFWPERSVLAYEYVEGSHWDGDLAGMAALLNRKEQADPTGFRTIPVTSETIMIEGDALFARCVTSPAAPRPRAASVSPLERLSLVHTDLGAANLIGQGDGMRIIDWQCPAQGDLSEDVYSFLSPAFQILSMRRPLSIAGENEFLLALARPDIAERYRRMRPAFAWRMAGYCSLRAETADQAEVRERYRSAALAELSSMEMPS